MAAGPANFAGNSRYQESLCQPAKALSLRGQRMSIGGKHVPLTASAQGDKSRRGLVGGPHKLRGHLRKDHTRALDDARRGTEEHEEKDDDVLEFLSTAVGDRSPASSQRSTTAGAGVHSPPRVRTRITLETTPSPRRRSSSAASPSGFSAAEMVRRFRNEPAKARSDRGAAVSRPGDAGWDMLLDGSAKCDGSCWPLSSGAGELASGQPIAKTAEDVATTKMVTHNLDYIVDVNR